MLIRPLTPGEAQAYVVLRREALADAPWAFSASPEDDIGLNVQHLESKLAEPGYAIVGAFDAGGKLVGSSGLFTNRQRKRAHRVYIWGVYVTPAARRQGVARAIMLAALDIARSWPGVTSAGLSVSVRSTGARALYESLGFVAWGTEPECLSLDGTLIDEVHMVCKFADSRRDP